MCKVQYASFVSFLFSLSQSGFSQTHKIANIGIIANFVLTYLQFPSSFAQYYVSKCEIGCQWVQGDYISRS